MKLKFVPKAAEICDKTLKSFISQVGSVEKLLVLTGAGVSTESGIPDYRSKDVGLYARISHTPMYHFEYMRSKRARQRYWSRNYLVWPKFGGAAPNINHYTLAKWEASDRFQWLITQNVDGLHQKAGSSQVTELHGSSHQVKCTNCNHIESRNLYQTRLDDANPSFREAYGAYDEIAPDGDMILPLGTEKDFHVPECPRCGGIIKTDVVFFGDNVPMDKVKHSYDMVDKCDGVLILGTSLSVLSGFKYAYHANTQSKPIFVVNIGQTRADLMATMKLEYKVSDVISHM